MIAYLYNGIYLLQDLLNLPKNLLVAEVAKHNRVDNLEYEKFFYQIIWIMKSSCSFVYLRP